MYVDMFEEEIILNSTYQVTFYELGPWSKNPTLATDK